MVHSVELTCDAATDAAVRHLWDELEVNGVRSQASHRSPSNRPHVTLTVAAGLAGAADTALAEVADRLPLTCRIGAPMLFGRGPYTLALLVIPSAGLLDLHAQVNRICLPHMESGPLRHTRPGQWTPHVTLARRLGADLLEQALAVAGTATDIEGSFAALRHWDGDARQEHPILLPG
ncbi:MAG: 2'-5' RNA ligase family protein [Mycobacterium sp.]|nr:2'-5' RNA ligase family protein [Mycobacterium sp.]